MSVGIYHGMCKATSTGQGLKKIEINSTEKVDHCYSSCSVSVGIIAQGLCRFQGAVNHRSDMTLGS